MASTVYLFHDEVRVAETAMAVLALLAKANLLRSHEVARVQPVIDMLAICAADATSSKPSFALRFRRTRLTEIATRTWGSWRVPRLRSVGGGRAHAGVAAAGGDVGIDAGRTPGVGAGGREPGG